MTKKHKKIKNRKRKKPGRSQTPPNRAIKKVPKTMIIGMIACVILLGIFLWWIFYTTRDNGKEIGQLTDLSEPKAATSELTPEEEGAALKKEEMKLARLVLTEFPESEGSAMLMGDLYARHGNSTEAVKFWEKCLETNPKHFDALRSMGRIALEKEQFDQAVTFLKKALEIRPNAAGLRSDIAKAFMDTGKYPEAITELEQEIKTSPSSFTARFQLAEAYRQQKEYDKAIENYELTIRLEPEHSHAHYGLAMVYTRTGQRDKARERLAVFRKFRDKADSAYSKRQVGAHEDLASLRASVAKTCLDAERLYRANGNTAKAEELLKRASKLAPNNTRCLERLASLYYATNRAAQALECFEQIVRINPNNPISYLNMGKVASRLRISEKAEQAFRKTIALAPSNPAGYLELARLYLRTNTNVVQAYSLAQKANALKKNAETYYVLGWAADVNGDRTNALQAMEQAIQRQPNNQIYRQIYERIKKRN